MDLTLQWAAMDDAVRVSPPPSVGALDESVLDADGSPAFKCGIEWILLGIVGIEDPLRPEVAPAIKSCTELASMCAW